MLQPGGRSTAEKVAAIIRYSSGLLTGQVWVSVDA
jgi:hypothetical protein